MHAFLALAFLFVMLVEWGSHSLAFAHAAPVSGLTAFSGAEVEHDDPCRTVVCCEGRKNDQTVPSISHDISPSSLLDLADGQLRFRRALREPSIHRKDVHGIFRPISPLLDPPEFS